MADTHDIPPPPVALYTLGAPRIERDGAPVHVDTRKATALLAYLALTRQRHSRDSLGALLWPDDDQPHARGALRRTLSTLHAVLPGEWLDVSREAIGLSAASGLWIDAAAFETALAQRTTHGHAATAVCPRCLEPLAQAAALYQDDFLAGFHLRECERFEDWQLWQRERLRHELASALEALARGHAARRAFGVAIGYARRWLDLDPLHEPAHRLLMKLYFWDGQRAAALRQYHVCAQALTAELGVAPLEATVALYAAIKERRAPEPPEMTPVALAVPAAQHVAPDRPVATDDTGAVVSVGVSEPPGSSPATIIGSATGDVNGASPQSATPYVAVTTTEPKPSRSRHGVRGMANDEAPFVGRTEELATLMGAYEALRRAWAIRGDPAAPVSGRVLVVEGEAGIGKTRLAYEFLARARDLGAATLAVRCYEGEAGLAYAPITAALRLAFARGAAGRTQDARSAADEPPRLPPWLVDLARLAPEVNIGSRVGQPQPPTDSARAPGLPASNSIEQARFFEGLRQALLALCQPAAAEAPAPPTILCIDDIQWADGASLDWLAYVIRRLDDYPLCLLLTVRSAELAQSAPLRRLLADAERAGVATVAPLGRLRREDMQALAGMGGARSGIFLAPSVINRLYDETEGTPFLLVEYLAALAQGALKPNAPEWRLPGGARNVLRARLNALSETAWQLLTAAAVIGRSFDGEIARDVSGRGEDEIVEALEELLARGLIVEHRVSRNALQPSRDAMEPLNATQAAGAGERAIVVSAAESPDLYDFSHAQMRELVYGETNQARRRLLHRRIGEALVARGRRRGAPGSAGVAGAGQIARHYQLAGQDELAADYYIQAGRQARDLYANAEALAHFRAALSLGHDGDPALHEAIGDLLTAQGEYSEALRSYESTIALMTAPAQSTTPMSPLTSPAENARLAIVERKLGGVYARRGEWDVAEGHVRAALRAVGDDGSLLPLVDGRDANGNGDDAQEANALRASLYADWSLLAHRQGNSARAQTLALAALSLAERAGAVGATAAGQADARRAQAQAHNMLGMLASGAGDADEAERQLARSLALAEALGDTAMQAAALNNLALVASGRGDLSHAQALTEQALTICATQGDRHHEAALANNLADLLHAAGRDADAMRALTRAVRIYAEIGVEAGAPRLAIWRLSEW